MQGGAVALLGEHSVDREEERDEEGGDKRGEVRK